MNMIPNCRGCEEEFNIAYEYQEEGLYLTECPFKKGHFMLRMVNDKGKIVVE